MPNSKNIHLWKEKAEIDYIPLFIPLWLSLNAWLRNRYDYQNDREGINIIKGSDSGPKEDFVALMQGDDADSNRFKGNFAQLVRSLDNANIAYKIGSSKYVLSFKRCLIDWNNRPPSFENILKEARQQNKIRIDKDLWVENNTDRVFAAYIETIYQIRCSLFHGDLAPTQENEWVVKQAYLTLYAIVESI